MSPRTVALVVPSLGLGGAERVVQLLARGFVNRGHRVIVVTTLATPDFYELDPVAERVRLDLTGSLPGEGRNLSRLPRSLWRLSTGLLRLREAITTCSPDLVVSFMDQTNVLTLLAVGSLAPVVATEHSDPRKRRVGWVIQKLRRRLYPKAFLVVSVSRGVDSGFEWILPRRRRVISNPIDLEEPGSSLPPEGFQPGRYVVAMGRLQHEKGFDLLLRAFAQIVHSAPGWRLAIMGDGPERERLEQDIESLGLHDSVTLLGMKRNPFPVLRAAGLFVMPSRWEGFGNALVEAMACGQAVVSFACPSGPDEIIVHGSDGLLIPPEDVDALASAMLRLIDDSGLREKLAYAARRTAARFAVDAIAAEWEREVFTGLIADSDDKAQRGQP